MAREKKLIFAIPSKGRLKSQCEEWLASKGIELSQIGGDRGYSAQINGLEDIEIRLLSSSEIAKSLLSGDIHLGITGEDLVKEASASSEAQVQIMERLGFGFADLVVAVPDGWIDVSTMTDLKDVASDLRHANGYRLKVATKFTRLTAEYFNQHGILDYRIVYSAGATEGAPSSGIAEVIVDITTSGATLSANNLKILDDGLILASCACFMKSKMARWGKTSQAMYQELQKRIFS